MDNPTADSPACAAEAAPAVPRLPYSVLFLKFLRFGLLAWGGPVAQIAMIKRELVEDERWIPIDRFNRTLAVYQVLPGPEAHEMCVYFGMLSRGRVGAVLAGLGFMLPGFVLMFALSWLYVTVGIRQPALVAAFAGMQAAVVALVVFATYRIGRHVVQSPALWGIAAGGFVVSFLGIHFAIPLVGAALIHPLLRSGRTAAASLLVGAVLCAAAGWWAWARPEAATSALLTTADAEASALGLFGSGLRAGLLTFGGAYTAIPFLQRDAVLAGNWMTHDQFLDGLGLSGVLPAPLIIFSTFVGFVGAGPVGATAMTAGIFLPAFGFTLLGHGFFERVTENRRLRDALDGVAAAVVGMIGATAVSLFRAGAWSVFGSVTFAAALVVLFLWRSKAATPVVILTSGLLGALLLGLR